MKIITLHQPWASLIALGLKKYETRHWATSYRGALLIHAAKRPMGFSERQIYLSAIENGRKSGLSLPLEKVPFPEQLPLGYIVAIADLSDCLAMEHLQHFTQGVRQICIEHESVLELSVGDWRLGRHALEMKNVRCLNPIPWKSRLGKLLDAPAEIVELVNQQVLEAVL